MPYDATFPQEGTLIDAAAMRAALAYYQAEIVALKARVTALEAGGGGGITQAQLDAAIAGTGNNTNAVADLPGFVASDPPLQSDVQAIADKVNELINTGHR